MNEYCIWLKDSNREVYVSAETRSKAVDKVLATFEKSVRYESPETGVIAYFGLSRADKDWLEKVRDFDLMLEDFHPPYSKEEITDDIRALNAAVEGAYDMIFVSTIAAFIQEKMKWYLENVGES